MIMERYNVRRIPLLEEGEIYEDTVLGKEKIIRFIESEEWCDKCCFSYPPLYDCERAKCTPKTRGDKKNGIFEMVDNFKIDRRGLYKKLHKSDYDDLYHLLETLPDKKYVWKKDDDEDDKETPIIPILPCDWDIHTCDFEVYEAFIEDYKVKLRGSVIDSFDEQIIDDVLRFVAFGEIYSITEKIEKE